MIQHALAADPLLMILAVGVIFALAWITYDSFR